LPRCAIAIDVFNSQFEEEEGNMFGVGASVEKSSHAFVVGEPFFI